MRRSKNTGSSKSKAGKNTMIILLTVSADTNMIKLTPFTILTFQESMKDDSVSHEIFNPVPAEQNDVSRQSHHLGIESQIPTGYI